MIILVDQDGPLADLDAGFLKVWRERFPDKPYIPLEERRSFHVSKDYPEPLRHEVDEIFFERGFFLNLPLVSGAVPALKEFLDLGHEIRICTSPLRRYQNCVLEKYRWVEKHFGLEFVNRIICSRDKSLVFGDILVDDKPEVDGAIGASWEHIIFDKPYNRETAGEKRRMCGWENWRDFFI
ncbi:MAG: 5'-3'-deoxyribonucleotidase [Candidatus Moraniibacteriota bacterium]